MFVTGNGDESDDGSREDDSKSVFYTFNGGGISGLAVSGRLDRNDFGCEDLGDYVIFRESQNWFTRLSSDEAIANLRGRCNNTKKFLVGTRWDLLRTNAFPGSPDLAQDLSLIHI